MWRGVLVENVGSPPKKNREGGRKEEGRERKNGRKGGVDSHTFKKHQLIRVRVVPGVFTPTKPPEDLAVRSPSTLLWMGCGCGEGETLGTFSQLGLG